MKTNKPIHSSFWSNIFKTPDRESSIIKSLLNVPLFYNLDKKDLYSLAQIVHKRNYVQGEYIFMQGDPGLGIYIIRKGEVMIKRKITDDYNIDLASFVEGDFFGELALIDGEKRSGSAIAVMDCEVSVIFKSDFDNYIELRPKKGVKILQSLSQIIAARLRKLNEENFEYQLKNKNYPED
ncbi:MAG: cyclic nucleotide-binding domain-containing protein [Syntrophothermus sp.]